MLDSPACMHKLTRDAAKTLIFLSKALHLVSLLQMSAEISCLRTTSDRPAEYLGGAITCDAYHMTDPRADGLGVSTCIELALKDAGIEKEQVCLLVRFQRWVSQRSA